MGPVVLAFAVCSGPLSQSSCRPLPPVRSPGLRNIVARATSGRLLKSWAVSPRRSRCGVPRASGVGGSRSREKAVECCRAALDDQPFGLGCRGGHQSGEERDEYVRRCGDRDVGPALGRAGLYVDAAAVGGDVAAVVQVAEAYGDGRFVGRAVAAQVAQGQREPVHPERVAGWRVEHQGCAPTRQFAYGTAQVLAAAGELISVAAIGGGSSCRAISPLDSISRRRSASRLLAMPGSPRRRSENRQGPWVSSSRTMSSVQRSPTRSSARAIEQYWLYERIISDTAPSLLTSYYRILAGGIQNYDDGRELTPLLADDLQFEGPLAGHVTGAARFVQGVKGFIANVGETEVV